VRAAWRRPAALLLWAAAVASAGAAGAALVRAPKPVTHRVRIDATRYQPATLAVHAGDTIVWVNQDLIPHTVTAKGGGFDSKAMAAGVSWRYTVKANGTADYGCLFHPTMTGRIAVK
jgi:plastocyanin